ncbi:radical SAM protein [Butyrivibrio sp. NC2002]|uniref:radical SAM protein n=1 Tax=Butyrivibrio sp. NC2002 TaxID=1410610 RepID=UPI00056C3F08|nr:radical SAM protein [Butyrivibrio sp. NC2002]
MKARLLNAEAPGGKRDNLVQSLPLSTPYVVQFFPIYACNFTCEYCHHSIPKNNREFVTEWPVMEYSLYEKCIDELAGFPEKVRTLRFVGMGEPLLHKDIIKMIKYAKDKKVSNRVELISNGSLLSHDMSDALISAGLDRLVISLQGTSAEKYKKVCGVDIDFDTFVSNIGYLFNKKMDMEIYLKIVDVALDGDDDRERFFKIFGDICDTIGIENAVPIFPDVEFNNVLNTESRVKTQFGLPMKKMNVCPQPFYTMQINPDGKIVGCYAVYYPRILGDCNNRSLEDIWNGEEYMKFRMEMLDGRANVCKFCKECKINDFRIFPEDSLDEYADELKRKYEELK